jgi:hypothetical protein
MTVMTPLSSGVQPRARAQSAGGRPGLGVGRSEGTRVRILGMYHDTAWHGAVGHTGTLFWPGHTCFSPRDRGGQGSFSAAQRRAASEAIVGGKGVKFTEKS